MPSFRATDGERLHYWDIGQGPVCVMVHGFGMPSFLWLPFVLPLMNRYRFILPDLRGFGFTHHAPIRQDTVFAQYAKDLHDLITHLELEKPALAGFSMGACTAMEYQRLYGFDNISAYLQIDQAMHVEHTEHGEHGLFGADRDKWMKTLSALIHDMEALGTHKPFDVLPKLERQRFWDVFSHFVGTAFHHPLSRRLVRVARNEWVIRRVAPVSNWPIYLACMRSFVKYAPDFRESMSQIAQHCPVWFFVGDESLMYPAEGQMMAAMTVAHARVVRFRSAGHAVMFDSPLRFVRKLDEFLAYSVRRQRRAKSAQSAASAVNAPEAVQA